MGGGVTENPLDMGVLLRKRVSLVCSTLRSRSLHYKHRLVQEVNFTVFPRSVAAGTICFSATNPRRLFEGGYYSKCSVFFLCLCLSNIICMGGAFARLSSHKFPLHILQQFAGRCLPLFGDGGPLTVPIHHVYPLDQASQAHSTMRENKNIGKLILEI